LHCQPSRPNSQPWELLALHPVLVSVTRMEHLWIPWSISIVKIQLQLLLRNKSTFEKFTTVKFKNCNYLRNSIIVSFTGGHLRVSFHMQGKWLYLNRHVHSFSGRMVFPQLTLIKIWRILMTDNNNNKLRNLLCI
jgi:hypothetical protein